MFSFVFIFFRDLLVFQVLQDLWELRYAMLLLPFFIFVVLDFIPVQFTLQKVFHSTVCIITKY